MVLYVVTQPDPAPGEDFVFTVPGNYLYDVTGITATLAAGAGSPVLALDASGTGADLDYDNPHVAFGIPGYVTGDTMVRNVNPGTGVVAQGAVDTSFLTGLDLFFNVWTDLAPRTGTYPGYVALVGPTSSISFQSSTSGAVPGGVVLSVVWLNAGFLYEILANDVFPAGRHMVSVRLSAPTGDGQFYVDGVPFGPPAVASGPLPTFDTTMTLRIGGTYFGAVAPNYDEIAVGIFPTTDADWASLYSQAGDITAYTTVQMGLGVAYYYHLDEATTVGGRQPSLLVTNGTNDLELIPTGFPAVTTPGPYQYSWQPQLNADTQSSDGTLTTVAIPQLLLPPGYTVGARTLDLSSADQWSDVTLWWDDAYQNAVNGYGAYDYGNGAHLVYRQIGT